MGTTYTHHMPCEECFLAFCFGRGEVVPTHGQLLASAAYNIEKPRGMDKATADSVKRMSGYWPQYIGYTPRRARADTDYSLRASIGRADRPSDEDYYKSGGLHHYYHITYLASPLWERLLSDYCLRKGEGEAPTPSSKRKRPPRRSRQALRRPLSLRSDR